MTDELSKTWPKDCPQRAFVEGAAWWQWYQFECNRLYPVDRKLLETEAVKLYGEPKKRYDLTLDQESGDAGEG